MTYDKFPPDDREFKAIVELLRNEVIPHLKPLGYIGRWEAVEYAAALLEWQHNEIAELDDLILAFDRAGIKAQPSAGEPSQDGSNNQWFSSFKFACSQEDIRTKLEKVRARHPAS